LLGSPRIRVPASAVAGWLGWCVEYLCAIIIHQISWGLNAGLFYTAAAIVIVRLIAGRASDRHGLFITVSLIFYTLSMLMLWIAISAVAFSSGGSRRVWCWNSDQCFAAIIADRSCLKSGGGLLCACWI